MREKLFRVLPHGLLICALAALTIAVADSVNSQMGLMRSTPGRIIAIAADVLALILGVRCILAKQ